MCSTAAADGRTRCTAPLTQPTSTASRWTPCWARCTNLSPCSGATSRPKPNTWARKNYPGGICSLRSARLSLITLSRKPKRLSSATSGASPPNCKPSPPTPSRITGSTRSSATASAAAPSAWMCRAWARAASFPTLTDLSTRSQRWRTNWDTAFTMTAQSKPARQRYKSSPP